MEDKTAPTGVETPQVPETAPHTPEKTGKKRLLLVSAALVLLVAGGAAAFWYYQNSQVPPPRYPVGVMLPETGDTAVYGTVIKKGIDLAIQNHPEYNLDLKYVDTGCDPTKATAAVKSLATTIHPVAIIGEVCSGASLAASKVAEQYKIPLVSAGSTSPRLVSYSPYFFRTVPNDSAQAAALASIIYQRGYRKLGVINTNEPYGNGLQAAIKDSFVKDGGSIVDIEIMERGDTDMTRQLRAIKAKGPDALYIASNSTLSSVDTIKQAQQIGITGGLFGSDALKETDVIDAAGKAADGLTLDIVGIGTSSFISEFTSRYGAIPTSYSSTGYDAVTAIYLALKNGAKTGEEVRSQLLTEEFDGASAHIKFKSSGDVTYINYDTYQVQDGKFVKLPHQ